MTVDITKLKAALPELGALFTAKEDANLTFNAGLDAVCEATGVTKAVLRKAVTAIHKDHREDAQVEAQELADLLDSLSEMA